MMGSEETILPQEGNLEVVVGTIKQVNRTVVITRK